MELQNILKQCSVFKADYNNYSLSKKMDIASKSDSLNNLGVLELQKGNISNAIDYYIKALSVMPINDDALINLATCYNKVGRYNDAILLCQEAIKIEPNRANGYRTIGDSFYYQSDIENVIKWYKESAKRGDASTLKWLQNNNYQ